MREKIIINDNEYDNASLDKKVGFIEDTHKYILVDKPDFRFNSVTTLLKDYKEPFDAVKVARQVVKKVGSKYFGRNPVEVAKEWEDLGSNASSEGTRLHAYGEDLLNNINDTVVPDLKKAVWVPQIVDKIHRDGYEVAKTELLVYSEKLGLAGQSDIILKKKFIDEYFYMIYDWKFLGKPLQKKSFYNPKLRSYKKMTGPFKHLMDCNWIHYSIQLAIYQTLTGDPSKIMEKVLVVVYDDGYELIPSYPMRVFWDKDLNLQAVYETWKGKVYDSRVDKLLNVWPKDILGR